MAQLPAEIRSLIVAEQAKQNGHFIEGVDLDEYMAKLADKAELLTDSLGARVRGVVAYYCNDEAAGCAYISLVLVDPSARRQGLASVLVRCVMDIARRRGFASCRLEVGAENEAAYAAYRQLGFRYVEVRGHKHLLEATL